VLKNAMKSISSKMLKCIDKKACKKNAEKIKVLRIIRTGGMNRSLIDLIGLKRKNVTPIPDL